MIPVCICGGCGRTIEKEFVVNWEKSIDKRNLDEMKDLKMNSEEYKDYRKGLSDAGTKKKDKLN